MYNSVFKTGSQTHRLFVLLVWTDNNNKNVDKFLMAPAESFVRISITSHTHTHRNNRALARKPAEIIIQLKIVQKSNPLSVFSFFFFFSRLRKPRQIVYRRIKRTFVLPKIKPINNNFCYMYL